jgi:hypothetical protein
VLVGNVPFSAYFLRPGTVALVHVNTGMLSMGYNLLCSLRKLRAHPLVDKIIFLATDPKAVGLLEAYRKKNNLSFGIYHPHTNHQITNFQPLASGGYYQMMRDRVDVYLTLVQRFRLSFLFMDADIVFVSDPLTDLFLNEDRGEPEDVIYSTDARNFYSELKDPFERQPFIPKICGGFFLMRPTKPAIQLLQDLSTTMRVDPGANDQWTMDTLLNSQYNPTSNTFIHNPNRTWLVQTFSIWIDAKEYERANKQFTKTASTRTGSLYQWTHLWLIIQTLLEPDIKN